jgi:hypothetical protein
MPFDVQNIRLAADLAVFHVALSGSHAGIDCGLIPLTASGTLEA